jgi:Crp-like helix-turn-helix domain
LHPPAARVSAAAPIPETSPAQRAPPPGVWHPDETQGAKVIDQVAHLRTPASELHRRASGNRLLGALPFADFAFLVPHLTETHLERGQVLFEPGDDVHTTYFLCTPTVVSLLVLTRNGGYVEAASVGAESAVGGIVSCGNKPAFGRSQVEAAGPAFRLPTERLEEAKSRSSAVGDMLARCADALLAQVMQSVACNALHSVENRCCRWLLTMHDRAGRETFGLTQEHLAEMLGVQRTTVTHAAAHLQALGAIRYNRGRVEVKDRLVLERLACDCYAEVESHYARLLQQV